MSARRVPRRRASQLRVRELNRPNFWRLKYDEDNLSVHWKHWKLSFELHLLAKGVSSDRQKVALLLHTVRAELQDLFYMLAGTEEELKPYKDVVKILES